MLAEGVVTWLGNPAVKFIENMNRAFELVVGLVTILVGASIMDTSRVWLVLRAWRSKNDASNHKDYSVPCICQSTSLFLIEFGPTCPAEQAAV